MTVSFHRIAYEALDVCNAVEMATIDAAVVQADLPPNARVLDIGCGNAAVSIRLAERFGAVVTAVELDPGIVELARERIAASSARARLGLHLGPAASVLSDGAPWDLIVAMGTTDPVGGGLRDPAAVLAALAATLKPRGCLLWGDLVWLCEPSPPLRQIIELSGTYADHDGWQGAARCAGLEVVSARVSDQALWDSYGAAMVGAVRDWLSTHPDHPDAPAVSARADQVAMMLDFGRAVLGFGLYLLRKPL